MAQLPKKKTTTRNPPVRKRNSNKPLKKNNFKKNIFIFFGVFVMIALVAFGYFLGKHNEAAAIKPDSGTKSHTAKESQNSLLEIKTRKPKESKTEIKKTEIKKMTISKTTKAIESKSVAIEEKITTQQEPLVKQNTKLAYRTKRPKLAIIIDDISTMGQIKNIQATGVRVTPSIFPPSKISMTSHTLARGLKHYMIHLPMESGTKQFNGQYKTLMTTFNQAQIKARVKELRTLFPTAKYVNNHTGSVFTRNYQAMNILYTELSKEGFTFIDSRTISSSVVPKLAREFNDAYVARDIFIDNQQNISYIHKQLRQAVKIAKKKGYAIAIGHPHRITMEALASAEDILKEVDLVYIDDIYKKRE